MAVGRLQVGSRLLGVALCWCGNLLMVIGAISTSCGTANGVTSKGLLWPFGGMANS